MDFIAKPHRLRRLLARFNLMVVLVLGLLLSNLLTGALAWYTSLHQTVEVTPFSGTSAYQKSALSTDAHYLSMMTENFIYSRLNVTPETVRASHKRLLSFANASYYPKLLEVLNKEARLISAKKISSYFDIKDIQLDEKHLGCTVTGKLKQASQSHAFHEVAASYYIGYQYHLGRLSVTQFTRLEPSDVPHSRASKKTSKKA